MNTSTEEPIKAENAIIKENTRRKGSGLGIFSIGLSTGLIVGFISALIFAPKSGADSRTIVKEQVDKGIDDIKGRVKEITGDRKKVYTETWKQPKTKPYNQNSTS